MNIELKEYITNIGEVILYNGTPDFTKLEDLSLGYGDIWHSSFEQGYKNAFQDIKYQTATFFWFVYDFDGMDECVSWRINPYQFAVRKTVWDTLNGFDKEYENPLLQALDFGYNAVRLQGGVSLYIKGLFTASQQDDVNISAKERYSFFIKNFKIEHSIYMLYRKGFYKVSEMMAFLYAKKRYQPKSKPILIKTRSLQEIQGNPTVSYIIPTMLRQEYTLTLLDDLANQTYPPTQVVIVDATPINQRDEGLYNPEKYPYEMIVKWQETKGSSRARNEAIPFCKGDYIVFGDDDIRLMPDFIENHIRFLQTYKAGASNGLDTMADHHKQDLDDLRLKLEKLGENRYLSGTSQTFNNANSCVKKEHVLALVGNDINYDGGYGEDSDFGFSLVKNGVVVLQNPFSASLHLKPPLGGYRFWGNQSKVLGKKRKKQPWELATPVKWIKPIPSPTIMYFMVKHFDPNLITEYKYKYFFIYLFKNSIWTLPLRLVKIPIRLIQYNKSLFYAKNLNKLGKRTA